MTEPAKDTIYVDVDDEITGIIDKLRSSKGKVVALVLPKRATVLQSIVNMKLLKRTADEDKKNLVLITTEAGLLPLAGAVGVHVAKTLTSRPEIPAAPEAGDPSEETVDEDMALPDDEPITSETAGKRPVGELAAAAGLGAVAAKAGSGDDAVETLHLDDDDEPAAPAAAGKSKTKPKLDKKLKVPSFDRFRLWILLGGAALLALIIFLYFATSVLPKATIAIDTNASNVNTNVSLTLDTTATALNITSNTVPAKQVSEQKTYTGTVTTTGTKNEGQKATGTVTMSAQECAPNLTTPVVPSGTGLTSGGLTYITQQETDFTSTTIKGSCINFKATSSTPIIAQTGGANYNTGSGTNFTVVGHSDVSASGSTSGGTDQIVQVVSGADITNATNKIVTNDATVKQDLQNQLQQQNLYPITATFSDGTPASTNSSNVGDATNSVTVTEVVTSTMLGAKQADIKTLVDKDIKSQIDTSKQGILDDGITQNGFKVVNTTATGAAMTLQTTAEVGPNIDTANIKKQAAGQKSGDIESTVNSDPDVTSVKVHFSPFWVTTAPKNVDKITVIVAKPTTAVNKND